ncbi:MAG: hypothetical protein QFX38_04780 [Methanothermobacter sp.]|nr:hypothetical protein [Methanothermobacter sp.]
MGDYEAGTATLIGIIFGIVMFVFFGGVFIYVFVGFIATYLTKEEDRSSSVGAIATLILAIMLFIYNMIMGPEMPYWISSMLGVDMFSFVAGFLLICFLAVCLGGLGGFLAVKASQLGKTEQVG